MAHRQKRHNAVHQGLDRPSPGSWLAPVKVEFATGSAIGQHLVFRPHDGWRVVRPGPGLLDGFIALASLPLAQARGPIHAYARKWGVLDLCAQHRLPLSHNPFTVDPAWEPVSCVGLTADDPLPIPWKLLCSPMESGVGPRIEPLSEWIRFASMVRSALVIGNRLAIHQEPGEPEDWLRILPPGYDPSHVLPWRLTRGGRRRAQVQVVAIERAILAGIASDWLRWGDVRPVLDWRDVDGTVKVETEFHLGGLFGAIAWQVHLALALSDGYEMCSGCGSSFKVEKRRARSRNKYCEECKNHGVDARARKQRSRDKAKAR